MENNINGDIFGEILPLWCSVTYFDLGKYERDIG